MLLFFFLLFVFCLFQAEDGIRGLVRSRGLGDVYKRQPVPQRVQGGRRGGQLVGRQALLVFRLLVPERIRTCLLYTSDAADERSSVDLGGRRIIKKKKRSQTGCSV